MSCVQYSVELAGLRLIRQLRDQLPNVFGSPGGTAGRQLDRLWEAARFHAFPPACLAEGNDAQHLRQSQEPRFWKIVHITGFLGSIPLSIP